MQIVTGHLQKTQKDQKLVNDRALPQDMFIHCIKTNDEFAKVWGLKVEERDLSLEERAKLVGNKTLFLLGNKEDSYNEAGIPTKLISLTYQNEKLEFYE